MRYIIFALMLSGCFDGEQQLTQDDSTIRVPLQSPGDVPRCGDGVEPGYYCSGPPDGTWCLRSDYVQEPCALGYKYVLVRRCEDCPAVLP